MALTDSLISAWELSEASGNAIDSHGSNDLTDTNTVGTGTGLVYGSARDFDPAADEGFTHADNADLSFADIAVTFEVWINPDAATGNGVFFSKGAGGAEYTFYRETQMVSWYVNGTFCSRGATLTAGNTWYHFIVEHDPTANELRLYYNNGSPTTVAHSAGGSDGAGDFAVGRSFYEHDGRIGPLRFWKRLLTSDERTELYNGGAGLAYSAFGGGGGPSAGAKRRRRLLCARAA